jgi:hypothetical protein
MSSVNDRINASRIHFETDDVFVVERKNNYLIPVLGVTEDTVFSFQDKRHYRFDSAKGPQEKCGSRCRHLSQQEFNRRIWR